MQLFTEHIHNGNSPDFFAELLLTPSNLSGVQNLFCAIIPSHKHDEMKGTSINTVTK